MTTPEHTLVGIHAVLACGCHRRWGWPTVALAGVASNLPDWDGLTVLFDMQSFDAGHRAWGHSFLSMLIGALLLAWTQHRFRWLERIARRLPLAPADPVTADGDPKPSPASVLVLAAIAFAAQAIHVPCDMVVSGGEGLSDWHVRPFWPLSNAGFVAPLIPWGDPGPTVVLMMGIIGCAKWRERCRWLSGLTLLVLVAYLFGSHAVRGMLAG